MLHAGVHELYRPFCGAGIWIWSQDWQLYSQESLVCETHSQFCENGPWVQNEFALQAPFSERAGDAAYGTTDR